MSDERLKQVFAESLELGSDVDYDSLEYRSIPQWDSLAHMGLVGEIEDTFGIMLETDDVLDMSSFTRAKEILAKYGVPLG